MVWSIDRRWWSCMMCKKILLFYVYSRGETCRAWSSFICKSMRLLNSLAESSARSIFVSLTIYIPSDEITIDFLLFLSSIQVTWSALRFCVVIYNHSRMQFKGLIYFISIDFRHTREDKELARVGIPTSIDSPRERCKWFNQTLQALEMRWIQQFVHAREIVDQGISSRHTSSLTVPKLHRM